INQAATLDFGTTDRKPGSYKIGLNVTAEGFNDASSETAVSVLAYQPPSGAIEISPAEIWAGETATLTANFNPGPCGGTIGSPSFSANEGSIAGNTYNSSTV